MANHLRTELVLDAPNMAIHNRRPAAGLVHHSERGSQYTSVEFGGRHKGAGLVPSMGSVADAYDNALAKSFVSTLKRELLHRHSWPSKESVRTGIFEYNECSYDPRRHSSLGHTSPVEYEEARMKGAPVASSETVRRSGLRPDLRCAHRSHGPGSRSGKSLRRPWLLRARRVPCYGSVVLNNALDST